MIITLDKMATRYHRLPSEIYSTASTFDLFVMDIGKRYEYVEEQKRQGKYTPPKKEIPVDQMHTMLKKVKNGKS